MTRAEKGDVRNYREGDTVVFHQDLVNYRLKKDEILTVTGIDHDRVMLLHPDGKPRGIRPAGSIRYRLDVYSPASHFFLVNPKGQVIALDHRAVVLGPIADPVSEDEVGLARHPHIGRVRRVSH